MDVSEVAGYHVIRRLGAGGMGQVFLVQHPRLPRRDALKLLDAGVSRNDDFKARFQREADLLAQLNHPNIVTLYDRGEYEGQLFITMEFVDGIDAGELLRGSGALTPHVALQLVAGAGAALDYAWRRQRITHRDVKPANILVAFEGTEVDAVKLADFGIAKAAGEATSLTSTGVTVGTMTYISPEAIETLDLDNRADVYSLGCTAYHLLAGRPPYEGRSITALMTAHLTRPAPSISAVAPHLPVQWDAVFAKVLAKDPQDRYQSCGEFVAALQTAALGAPPPDPRFANTGVGPPAYDAAPATVSRPVPGPRAPGRRNRSVIALAVVAAALVVAVGVFAAMLIARTSGHDIAHAAQSTATTVAATAAPVTSAQPSLTPSTASSIASTQATSTAKLIGKWGRHNILLTLNDGGSGTYIVTEGAMNSVKWSIVWTAMSATSASVVLIQLISTEGSMSSTLHTGQELAFTISGDGYAAIDGTPLCTRDDPSFQDTSSVCGA